MGFREVGINRHIQPGRSGFDPAQHQMLHRIKANCAAFESTLYPGFNIRDLEDLQQSQNLNELTFALFTHPGLHKAAQDEKGFRQFPISQRGCLILDDWGPDRLTASQRRDLMEIVEDRYGAGSTLITSQLPLSTWHDVIGEPTFADAILDRIVHNAYRLELSGQSLRKTMAKTGDENCQR